jgi:hypothetical protein
MKRLLIFALLLIPTAVFADDDAYTFRASWVDGHYELTDAVGAHWKWMKFGCPKNVECELRINSRGGAAGEKPADLGFSHVDDQTLGVRCLRKSGCSVGTRPLAFGESMRISSGSIVEFSAAAESQRPRT